jgi:hypothetical protein
MNMNRPTDFDQQFRDRLYQAEVQPPEFVWPNIEATLRKKRRRFVFWLLLGLMTTGGAAFWYFGQRPDAATSAMAQQDIKTNARRPEATHETPVQPRTASTPANDAAPTPEATVPSDISTIRNVLSAPQFRIPAAADISTVKTTLSPKTPVAPPAGQREKGPETTLPTQVSALENAIAPASQTPPAPPAQLRQPSPLLTDVPELLDYKNPVPQTNLHAKPPKVVRFRKASRHCYDFAKNPNAWLIDVYAGPTLVKKELSVNNPEVNDYLKLRQDTERKDWAYNLGVRGTFVFDRYFMLRTGLHYEQMTEVFEYIDPAYIKYGYSVVLDPITGDTLDRQTTIEYGAKKNLVYNRFGMLDIPLMAGIEWRKGRSGFNINAGVTFNILFWKRGAILSNTARLPRYFTPGNTYAEPIFKTHTGLSATCSVQWFYHLKPRLRVFAEPYFRQIVQPVNLDTHPVNQRYGTGGIRLGLTRILQ